MNNDAAALAADFAEDAVLVEQGGPTFGREAIEKHWADRLQKVHFSNLVSTVDPDSPHSIGADGKEVWATGGWSTTIKGEDFGPTQLRGYFSVLREGDDWKIRMLTTNVTPASAQQTNTPDSQLRDALVAYDKKYHEAFNNNDAAAVAALYTEDAVEVTDAGPIYGRKAIEKHWQRCSRSGISATISSRLIKIPPTA